jgi:uncharacterized protein (DUF2249 family)
MTEDLIPIEASDRLQTLFERDERLIDVVASHSPHLAKLRNSLMRRVMARVTTVAQVARLCNMSTESLVRDLNRVLGIDSITGNTVNGEMIANRDDLTPFPPFKSTVELDVREELSDGGEPFSRIMSAIAALGDGEILHLRAPFEPVPLLSVLEKRGLGHRVQQHGADDWSVWFFHQTAEQRNVVSDLNGSAISTGVPVTNEM